jgi:hypothetical protein
MQIKFKQFYENRRWFQVTASPVVGRIVQLSIADNEWAIVSQRKSVVSRAEPSSILPTIEMYV